MYAFAAAFIQPGDEVILFEPYFDQYTAQVKFKFVVYSSILFDRSLRMNDSGGVPVFVPIRAPAGASDANLSSSDWKIDFDELKAAVTPKTKMIWVNSVCTLLRTHWNHI